eukprot:UN05237
MGWCDEDKSAEGILAEQACPQCGLCHTDTVCPCDTVDCRNGGTCQHPSGTCNCVYGYTGTLCETSPNSKTSGLSGGSSPSCESTCTWNAGHGGCDTYDDITNNAFCDVDKDYNGVFASQACPQCGHCTFDDTCSVVLQHENSGDVRKRERGQPRRTRTQSGDVLQHGNSADVHTRGTRTQELGLTKLIS